MREIHLKNIERTVCFTIIICLHCVVPTDAHGSPSTQTFTDETPIPTAGYDKGFFLRSEDNAFLMKLQVRLKTRYTLINADSPTSDERQTDSAFSVPFARLFIAGHLFNQRLSYVLQPDFGGGNVRLMLAYGDYAFIPQTIHLSFGQLKRPFSRHFIVPSVCRAFIRGATGQIGQGIDIGLQLSNDFTRAEGLEWAFGVFNGSNPTKSTFTAVVDTDDEGQQTVSNGSFSNAVKNFSPALTLRLGYNNGIKGYRPTDFEGGPLRFGVAASGYVDFDVDDSDSGVAYLSGDAIAKAYGFSSSAAVYVKWSDKGNVWDNPSYAATGAVAQAGYFFADHFEPVVRYGVLNPEGRDNMEQEATVGLTFFFYKQVFKLENNFSVFILSSDESARFQFSSQLQVLF